ncbi:GNAT family N-acetyltransferase [Lentzea flaviverrucosa]|uniref:Protein N-acetyltransferase, RimJ/RimL family n=1 Tax=Lentzea flaviverrucosa TaxID=200379 RepID=A0A1H9TXV9_9PSEU|nr:GNAT family protein [Lentzea flaviverrucosa]RDI33427.1 RimJ/RimL family protein N-acetyltransferase [Lentzea flaviverrucosa]SES01727.1 Protein N-acetyltransferase, RimJ/RimL family [Lentzea flaviverrucosa]
MEPVEINAGEYYLRAFRSDDRIDDVPVLAEAFADAETKRYMPRLTGDDAPSAETLVLLLNDGWEKDYRWSWAVCEAVTAEVMAGIVIHNVDRHLLSAEVMCWSQPRHRGKGVLPAALNSVLGWVYGAMEMHRVTYRHAVSNTASQRVAEKCGFTLEGRLREEAIVDDQREDQLLWSRLASDPFPEQLR